MIRAPSRAKLRYSSITLQLSIQILLYITISHVQPKHVMENLHSSQVCLLIVVVVDLETVRERHPRWPAWWFEQCADEFEGGVYGYEQRDWEVIIYLSLAGFHSNFDKQLQCYLVQSGACFVNFDWRDVLLFAAGKPLVLSISAVTFRSSTAEYVGQTCGDKNCFGDDSCTSTFIWPDHGQCLKCAHVV